LDLYEDQGDDIYAYDSLTQGIAKISSIMFGPAYDDDNLEDILHSYFGEMRLSELLKPSLITAYDIEKRQAKLFTSLDAKRSESHDFYLRDVVRATSAAPSYFTPAEIKSISGGKYALIDGAVFANNPTMCALTEARKIDFSQVTKNPEKPNCPKPEQLFILSLGTGSTRQPYKFEEAKNFKSQNWTKPLLDIVMSSNSEITAYQVGKIYEKKSIRNGNVPPENYVRIDINLSNEMISPDMADASADNINQLKDIAYRLADDESELLDRVATQLINNQ
jgi:patatin-like phospholipase/acyl hydrolase